MNKKLVKQNIHNGIKKHNNIIKLIVLLFFISYFIVLFIKNVFYYKNSTEINEFFPKVSFGIDIVGPAFVVLPAMPFQGAAADIQAGNDDVADPGPFQQAGKVFRPVVGEAVSHRQDPEGVGVAGQGIVGRSREGDKGQKDNKKDSLHKWMIQ